MLLLILLGFGGAASGGGDESSNFLERVVEGKDTSMIITSTLTRQDGDFAMFLFNLHKLIQAN